MTEKSETEWSISVNSFLEWYRLNWLWLDTVLLALFVAALAGSIWVRSLGSVELESRELSLTVTDPDQDVAAAVERLRLEMDKMSRGVDELAQQTGRGK